MHELEIIKGQVQMAYAKSGGVPWHGLGVEVDDCISSDDMMTAAGLDWEVQELPTYADMNLADGGTRRVETGMKALVRETDGQVLTQVGPNWHPVQNDTAFKFFKEFVDEGMMKMHTAGSLKDGRIVWALAKVDDGFEVFDGDQVDSYLLFTNPHQYGKVVDVRFTPIRVVCNNTLTLSLSMKSKGHVKINHCQEFNPDNVKELMGIAKFKLSNYKEMAQFLGSKRATDATVKEYFGELLGKSAKDDKELSRNGEVAMKVLDVQPGAEFAKGTWWQPYNAITYMTDHILGRTNDTRMESAWYGNNAKLKTRALELALDMANKS